jgi:N-acetylglutamate synthase-like GNAT family acetyltransferase
MTEILNLIDEPDCLETLAAWHHSEWSYLYPGESVKDRINRMQSYLSSNFIPSTFIAKDNALSGSCAIIEHDMETRLSLTPWLASVFVAPEYRQQGIGSKLVLHAMTQAKKEGISTLYLFTPDNKAFYLKLGWTIMCTEKHHGHAVTVMQAILNKE